MSNQLENKQRTLAQLLASNRLTKMAADQKIEHKSPEAQTDLGKEQTEEVNKLEGTGAATAAADNKPKDNVQELPGCQSLNASPESALRQTGTGVDEMDEKEKAKALPKQAAYYRQQLAGIIGRMDKKAALERQVQETQENFRTGYEVMQKLASLTDKSTDAEFQDAHEELMKLAKYNPLFNVCRDRILMRKVAEDIEQLAAAEGITPEEAQAALGQAVEADPSLAEDADAEATQEAVSELAGAEDAADQMMAGIEQMAANASNNLGVEVLPEDIMAAADEVAQQAQEMGVPPEALIQQAMEELQAGEDGSDVTEEDLAQADAILQEAAENGISPDEVIQMAAEELGDGGAGEAQSEPVPEEVKQASLKLSPAAAAARKFVRH